MDTDTDLHTLGAAALARRIRLGELSSRTLVEHCLARIARFNPQLNAIVCLRVEEALASADEADTVLRAGRCLGPLHGVPVTIKECFDWTGTPSTFGRPERLGHRAAENAVAVARLLAAGAIVLGKTNVPLDLADWQTFNAAYGATMNPWDTGRSPGGSSGGAAVALAAGFSALEIGSDNSGSIRMPAHFCGVYGHKPTWGIVPVRGHALEPGLPPDDVNVVGPLARNAEDLDLAMRLLAGVDGIAARAWRLQLPEPDLPPLDECRIAVITGHADFPVDADTTRAALDVAARFSEHGAHVTLDPPLPIPGHAYIELFLALARGSTSFRRDRTSIASLAPAAAALDPDDRGVEALMLRSLTQSHRDWLERNAERQRLREAWEAFFQRHHALIAPVSPTPAFPHMHALPKSLHRLDVDGTSRPASDTYFWIGLASAANLPATAIPAGRSTRGPGQSCPAGLPIGLQVIGPEYADLRCIALARVLETIHRRFDPPPGYE
ncbi:MAG: amidase [Proteobacteria bacterium]|nr:amidase [Burkholderiales bacterium]